LQVRRERWRFLRNSFRAIIPAKYDAGGRARLGPYEILAPLGAGGMGEPIVRAAKPNTATRNLGNSDYAALYFPWMWVFDSATQTMHPDGEGEIPLHRVVISPESSHGLSTSAVSIRPLPTRSSVELSIWSGM